MRRPLLLPIIAFLAGVVSVGISGTELLPEDLRAIAGALILFFVLAAWALRRNKIFGLAVTLLFFLLGAFRYASSVAPGTDDISRRVSETPYKTVLYGSVTSSPERYASGYYEYSVFGLRSQKILIDGHEKPASGNIMVSVFGARRGLPDIGDNIVVSGKISSFKGAMNPASADYRVRAGREGVSARLSCSRGDILSVVSRSKTPVVRLRRNLSKARDKAFSVMERYLDDGTSAFAASVILGMRSGIAEETKTLFSRTGTMHILAVSGLHVGIVAFVIMWVLKLFRLPRGLMYLMTAAGVICFAVFTGCRPSSMRAAVMAAFLLAGLYVGRKSDLLNALAISALVITFFDPGRIFSPGFLLSYLAVLSIIYITPLTDASIRGGQEHNDGYAVRSDKFKGKGILYSTVSYFVKAGSLSLAVFLGMVPIVAYYFRIVTPSVVISNLAAIPSLFVSIILGALLLISGSVGFLIPVADISAGALSGVYNFLMVSLGLISRVPGSYIRVPSPGVALTLLFYGVLSLTIFLSRKRKRQRFYLAAFILFTANFFVWLEVSKTPPASTRVTFFSASRSDASLFEFPDGSVMLIDTGTSGRGRGRDIGKSVIEPYLAQRGVRKIDCVVMTHPHDDHIGGLLSILESFSVGTLIDNGYDGTDIPHSLLYREVMDSSARGGVARITVRRGDLVKGLPLKEALVLNPPQPGHYGDLNDDSIVMRIITEDGKSYLFSGDVASDPMRDMLSFGESLASDVLKAPHHGAGLGDVLVLREFLNNVSPRYIVITNDKTENVEPALLRTAGDIGAQVLITGKTGAVIFEAPPSE